MIFWVILRIWNFNGQESFRSFAVNTFRYGCSWNDFYLLRSLHVSFNVWLFPRSVHIFFCISLDPRRHCRFKVSIYLLIMSWLSCGNTINGHLILCFIMSLMQQFRIFELNENSSDRQSSNGISHFSLNIPVSQTSSIQKIDVEESNAARTIDLPVCGTVTYREPERYGRYVSDGITSSLTNHLLSRCRTTRIPVQTRPAKKCPSIPINDRAYFFCKSKSNSWK